MFYAHQIIITTDLMFVEWPRQFSDATMPAALLDQLTHRYHIAETGKEPPRLGQCCKNINARIRTREQRKRCKATDALAFMEGTPEPF